MKRNFGSRLSALRGTGEIKTGRQVAKELETETRIDLFPGEGREEETSYGRCYLRELKFPLDYKHGEYTLSGFLSCSGPVLALPARDESLLSFKPENTIFLDIETTGLSGGTGTWAFLIGLGWADGGHFTLRQYFMRRPSEERAILSHLKASVSDNPVLVTFNGKQFDLPLIRNRQVLAGFRPFEPEQHLDLLQCARSLWKKRLASRSLRSLEESLLGLRRIDDIPGAEIPEVYFNYLRRGETELLKKVFHHNVLDILSMATLLERVYRTTSGELVKHPAESLALGCLCLEAGRCYEGISHLREAASWAPDPLAEEAALKLSFHFKQQGRWEEAVKIWEKTAANNPRNIPALVELAKYYEHRAGKYRTALELTEKAFALARLSGTPSLRGCSEFSLQALRHRLNRLNRRLGA